MKLLLGSGLVLLAIFLANSVEIYHNVSYVCWDTASWKGYREWPGGLRTGLWEHPSVLEDYVSKPVVHHWRRISSTGVNLLGRNISFGCGMTDGVEMLHRDVLTEWTRHHSRAEVKALLALFATYDPKAIGKRVDEIRDEVAKP